jgi:signal transduction histidine kinase/ActR/RegA family two-component response regulator
MSSPAHVSGQRLPLDDPLDGLRTRVLRIALAVLAGAMPLISTLLIAGAISAGRLDLRTFLLSASVLTYPLLWALSGRLGFTRTAIGLLALLAFSAFILASRGGLTVGYAAVHMIIVLASGLFFGRRGAAAGLGVVLGVHLLAWAVVGLGIVPPISTESWDPRLPAVWLRHTVILACLGLVVALLQLYVVEQLAQQVARYRELAERELQQRLSLERAEQERAHEREQRERAQHALDQARRLEALARLSGGIAHDFNNALTVIIGTADVARLNLSSATDVAGYLDEIVEAAKRAGGLTAQLLSLGRAQMASRGPLDMVAWLGRLQSALRRVLPDDVALVVDLPAGPVIAEVDAIGLERAVYNLALNARDAMPGGGTITIACRYHTVTTGDGGLSPGQYVLVSVADTGHGMDAQTLERIFDPFFTTKSERGGTGLGLATVYAFARDAGGQIEAASTPERGTSFTLLLPAGTRAAAAEAPIDTAAPPAPQGIERHILVVEDRDDVRANLVRMLTSRGFAVDEAADGGAALALLAGGRQYAVMCIDGVMPGLRTADVIDRASQIAPSMGVLVCSGYVREDLLRRGVEAGRYAFLAKPFTADQLAASVDGVLRSVAHGRTSR